MSFSKSRKDYVANEVRLVLVGKTGTGKSATANTIAGKKVFRSAAEAVSVTDICQHEMCKRFNRYLQIIDVPGFLDTSKTRETVNKEIIQCVAMASPGIHAILFNVRIGRFTEEDVRTVREFIGLFGPKSKDFVIVVFTGLDDLLEEDRTLESFIQNAPVSLKQFLREVNNRYIGTNNRASEEQKEKFVEDLICKIEQMLRDNDRSYYTCSMFEDAEEHLIKMQKAKEKKLEEENKSIIDAKVAAEVEKFIKELEKLPKITELEKTIKIEQKKEQQIQMINFEHQRDAREFTRMETCKQIVKFADVEKELIKQQKVKEKKLEEENRSIIDARVAEEVELMKQQIASKEKKLEEENKRTIEAKVAEEVKKQLEKAPKLNKEEKTVKMKQKQEQNIQIHHSPPAPDHYIVKTEEAGATQAAVAGAAAGAMAGAFLGPVGAGAGAFIGGAVGAATKWLGWK